MLASSSPPLQILVSFFSSIYSKRIFIYFFISLSIFLQFTHLWWMSNKQRFFFCKIKVVKRRSKISEMRDYYLNERKRRASQKKIKFMSEMKCMLSWFNALREKRVYFDNHLTLFSAFNHQKIISRQSIVITSLSIDFYFYIRMMMEKMKSNLIKFLQLNEFL